MPDNAFPEPEPPVSLEFEGEACEIFARLVDDMPGYGATIYRADDPETPIEVAIIGRADDDETLGPRWDTLRYVRAVADEYDVDTLKRAGAPVETAIVRRVVIS